MKSSAAWRAGRTSTSGSSPAVRPTLLALAGAVSLQPDILILDEPIAQLDPMHADRIYAVLRDLNENHGKTIVVIEHHTEYIADFCKHVMLMRTAGCAGCYPQRRPSSGWRSWRNALSQSPAPGDPGRPTGCGGQAVSRRTSSCPPPWREEKPPSPDCIISPGNVRRQLSQTERAQSPSRTYLWLPLGKGGAPHRVRRA